MNLQEKCSQHNQIGCLTLPENFFIRDLNLQWGVPNVFTQLWYYTVKGIPTKLKNTRSLDYLSSYETWNDLIGNGWRLVEQQFNAFVDAGIKIPPGLYVPHNKKIFP